MASYLDRKGGIRELTSYFRFNAGDIVEEILLYKPWGVHLGFQSNAAGIHSFGGFSRSSVDGLRHAHSKFRHLRDGLLLLSLV